MPPGPAPFFRTYQKYTWLDGALSRFGVLNNFDRWGRL